MKREFKDNKVNGDSKELTEKDWLAQIFSCLHPFTKRCIALLLGLAPTPPPDKRSPILYAYAGNPQ